MKNPFKIDDPEFAKQASQYEHPVPSRVALIQFLETHDKLLKLEQIAEAIGIETDEQYIGLKSRLKAMVKDGQLIVNRRKRYGARSKMNFIQGRVEAHADGFGFLISSELKEDAFITPRQMRQVMSGDVVLADIRRDSKSSNRQEAFIVEVLDRAHSTVAGKLIQEQGQAYVQADNNKLADIIIPNESLGSAKHNDYVTVSITQYPSRHRPAFGQVIAVLGQQLNHQLSMQLTIVSEGLPHQWPDKVEAIRAQLPTSVDIQDIGEHQDIRDLPLITIDGADARDFDDAVYVEAKESGYRLVVAIADVSSYVKPRTVLDKEAYHRGTSVYFPGKVIPMLPVELSNGICSLNPNVDRLSMVCDMHIDATGEVTSYEFYRGLMESHARCTYDEVWHYLDQQKPRDNWPEPVLESLQQMYTLFHIMQQQKYARGAIEFRSTDVKIDINTQGMVDDIQPYTRNDAHKIIENFMIAANVCAARFIEKHKVPGAFRVHQPPPESKVKDLLSFLQGLGVRPRFSEQPTPKEFAQLSSQIKHRADSDLIQQVMLRSQSLATYESKNGGHFGLALSHYGHFTSPIRRYPDLLVHRAIDYILYGKKESGSYLYGQTRMEEMCKQCSMTERRAEMASREVDARLKCLFMQQFVGEDMVGVVSGVTRFGLFVVLEQYQVDGLVHVTSLPNDYYDYDSVQHKLQGERSGQVFQLLDKIKVRIAAVDVDDRKIDFDFISSEQIRIQKKKRKSKPNKKKNKGKSNQNRKRK